VNLEIMMSHQLKNGGDERDRTADPLLARQVLSQLSYTPTNLSYNFKRTIRISKNCKKIK
jgi:hypothetical protein